MKTFSLRLSKVLDSIIDPDQTCSVPGRSIVSNLQLIRDTLDFIDRTGESGILVSLDQEKAFGLGSYPFSFPSGYWRPSFWVPPPSGLNFW